MSTTPSYIVIALKQINDLVCYQLNSQYVWLRTLLEGQTALVMSHTDEKIASLRRGTQCRLWRLEQDSSALVYILKDQKRVILDRIEDAEEVINAPSYTS